jgi:ketosteroid isomerase-like protein
MSAPRVTGDRVEIETLRGEFTDAIMMPDYDRLASLFTDDGAVRMPYINVELAGREEIRAGTARMQGHLDYFVQTTHPGSIQLDDDAALVAGDLGRRVAASLPELGQGQAHLSPCCPHDRSRAAG